MAAQVCEADECSIGCGDADDCIGEDVCIDHGNGLHCANGCQAPGDCVLQGGDAWDADNWSCEQAGCRYLGCSGDDECLPGQVCRDHSGILELLLGYDAPVCVIACDTNADCDLGAEPTTADNYECVDGGCNWLGCLDDDECPAGHTCE
jgi:hypothetical protein